MAACIFRVVYPPPRFGHPLTRLPGESTMVGLILFEGTQSWAPPRVRTLKAESYYGCSKTQTIQRPDRQAAGP